MKLLVIRHARAEDREVFADRGLDDAQRPLTSNGKKRMREVSKRLHEIVPEIDVIATSPLVRAEQTARIVSRIYGGPDPVVVDSLAPGGYPELVASWLQGQPEDATVALVGHEPDLGQLVTWLLSGLSTSFLHMKKGGVCLLEFQGPVGAKRAELAWSLTPRTLRRLG